MIMIIKKIDRNSLFFKKKEILKPIEKLNFALRSTFCKNWLITER